MKATTHCNFARIILWRGFIFGLLGALGFLSLACDDKLAPALSGLSIFGVDNANNLVRFGSMTPQNVTRRAAVTGLQTGESIFGVDFRPADNLLYALGSTNRIYVLDTLTAAARPISVLPFAPALAGAFFGVDFNPVADRIRVHSSLSENVRLDQQTGVVAAVDTALAYALTDVNVGVTPRIVASAYTNSVAGATGTVLYAIDSNRDILVSIPSPNSGQIRTVGSFGIYGTNDFAGFDIDGGSGAAYATLTSSSKSTLFSVSLNSGAMTLVGDVNNPSPLVGIAIAP
jgi:hypothetical protein